MKNPKVDEFIGQFGVAMFYYVLSFDTIFHVIQSDWTRCRASFYVPQIPEFGITCSERFPLMLLSVSAGIAALSLAVGISATIRSSNVLFSIENSNVNFWMKNTVGGIAFLWGFRTLVSQSDAWQHHLWITAFLFLHAFTETRYIRIQLGVWYTLTALSKMDVRWASGAYIGMNLNQGAQTIFNSLDSFIPEIFQFVIRFPQLIAYSVCTTEILLSILLFSNKNPKHTTVIGILMHTVFWASMSHIGFFSLYCISWHLLLLSEGLISQTPPQTCQRSWKLGLLVFLLYFGWILIVFTKLEPLTRHFTIPFETQWRHIETNLNNMDDLKFIHNLGSFPTLSAPFMVSIVNSAMTSTQSLDTSISILTPLIVAYSISYSILPLLYNSQYQYCIDNDRYNFAFYPIELRIKDSNGVMLQGDAEVLTAVYTGLISSKFTDVLPRWKHTVDVWKRNIRSVEPHDRVLEVAYLTGLSQKNGVSVEDKMLCDSAATVRMYWCCHCQNNPPRACFDTLAPKADVGNDTHTCGQLDRGFQRVKYRYNSCSRFVC